MAVSTTLYIQFYSQVLFDTARSTFAGILNYTATGYNAAPPVQCIYDYGASNNSAATPFPVFVDDAAARAFFDSTSQATLLSYVNASVGSTYYTSATINTVDAPIQADFSSLATVATTGSYTDLTNTPAIPAAQVNTDWNSSSGLSKLLNKPSLSTVATSGAYSDLTGKPSIPAVQAYEGTVQRLGAFPVFKDATVASGVAVFNLTNDGTSTGTALFPSGVIQDSVNVTVSDATASYQMSWAWSNSNKTLTVTTNKLTTANILTGILGQAAANGSVVKLQVWGY